MIVDVVVLVVALLAGWAGWRAGGLRTVAAVLGWLLGATVGLWVSHLVAAAAWPFAARVVTEVAVVLLGIAVGLRVAHATVAARSPTSSPDRVLGLIVRGGVAVGVAGVAITALAAWGPAPVAGAADSSRVVAASRAPLAALTPQLRAVLPGDLGGVVPALTVAGASTGDATLTSAETAATVQVSATTSGSATTSVGSGFVVSGRRVVTAHHVVAGADTVTVVAGGDRLHAVVTVDDARTDVAVLTVAGLQVGPVTVSGVAVADGSHAVLAGYPGGGPLRAGSATVVGGVALPVASQLTLRPGYRLTADVAPGNSGGPLFDDTGQVIGMIDARSLTDAHVGYALTAEPVLAALAGA